MQDKRRPDGAGLDVERRAGCSVLVESDWATLREVVVGRPFLRIPRPFPRQRGRLDAETWRLIRGAQGQPLSVAFPQLHARVVEQMQDAARLLRGHGVVVREVPPLTPADEHRHPSRSLGAFQYFTRDPVLVVGDRVIELTTRGPGRHAELLPLSRLLDQVLSTRRARWTRMEGPARGAGPNGRRALLEGGDCLLAPDEVFVGLSGRGSNRRGIHWLRRELKGERAVTPVLLAREAAHLDMALCLVRPGLGIRCRAWLPAGVPHSLRRWAWVDVSRREALDELAVNCLPIDEATTLVAAEAPRLCEALVRRGQRVVATPFSTLLPHAGGLRCWSLPLSRVD